MKKTITVLLLILNIYMFAQPILNVSDLNPYGTANLFTTNPTGFTTGLSGANQTWNYSGFSLTPNGTAVSTSITTSPFANSFPEANYFIKTVTNGSSTYSIYKLTSEKLELLGLTTDSSIIINFSPNPQTQFEFPYTYNSSINDTYSTTNDPDLNDPFSIIYDAYGTLITPYGTYNNVIRTKKMDGAFPIYSWYTINPTITILTAIFGSGGISSVKFYQYNNLSITQNEIQKSYDIIPNPASNNITILNSNNLNETFEYKIFDIMGRIIKKSNGKFNEKIDIENLQIGNYIIQISDKNKNLFNKKLIKK